VSRIETLTSRVAQVAADLSGIPPADLNPASPFLALGFDSLLLTQFAATVQKEFGVRMTFRQLMQEASSITALAAMLDKALPAEAAKPAPAPAAPAQPVAESAPAPVVTAASVVAAPRAEIAPRAAMPVNVQGLEAVFQAQLALMREQLELLGGSSVHAIEAAAPMLAAPAPQPITAQPAAVASAAPTTLSAPSHADKPKFELPKGFGPQIAEPKEQLTASQKAHIDRLIARYNTKTAGSKRRTEADRPHFADPRTAAGFNRLWKEMVYPIVVERSHGTYLWDVDGNKYVDMLNGFGPNFFGHRAPFVVEALKAQLDAGFEVGPQTPKAGAAAKLFCELTGMDRVSWVNTGSEAVQAAIRLARTVTGRDKIVVFSGDYHGNFDEVLVRVVKNAAGRRTVPMAPGIPFASVGNVIVLDYGEDSALEAIAAEADDIAAVLVEPVQSRRPEFRPKEFLHKLRKLTKEKGIVLVFDEVITGFRISPGGAQEYYGVEADLATYGKIIGGGMPIGVVAGRSEFMDTFDGGQWRYGDDSMPTAGVTFFAGTFVRHPFAIAAAHASLSYLKSVGPALQEGVNKKATRLAETLNAFFAERGVKIFVAHFASQMFFRVSEESDLATLFFYHLRDRGVHVLEGFPSYVTAAHTDEDIDFVIAAATDSILEMQADGVLPVREGVAPVSWKRKLPLTAGQKEVWVTAQLGAMANCALNESDAITIEGPLDADRFVRSVEASMDAHESFRLRFATDGSMQSVEGASGVVVNRVDLSGQPPARQAAAMETLLAGEASTPFDLANGPLVRPHLVRYSADKHVFLIYAHHIAFDGYSAELLLKDIAARYSGGALEGVEQFTAYAAKASSSEALQESGAFWRSVYADGAPPALDLPTDRPYPARRAFDGSTARGRVGAELTGALKEAAKRLGVGAYAMLLSAYAALLSRLTGQDDLVIGVPAAGQADLGVECVGFCVNMLPMRMRPAFDRSFADLAKATQSALVEAMERQAVSLSDLARTLNVPRDSSRASLIQAVFNYSGYFGHIDLEGCKVSAGENRRAAVHHELFINLTESGDGLAIDWDYASSIFDADTIDRWIAHLTALLSDIAAHPDATIGQLSLTAPRESVVVALRAS